MKILKINKLNFLYSSFKKKNNITNLFSIYTNINKRFTTDKKDQKVDDKQHTQENTQEQVLDIIETGSTTETSNGRISLKDYFSPKSVKMGPPNISKWIDRSKITNPQVKLGKFDKNNFVKSTTNDNIIPISPVFEPFEVSIYNIISNTIFTI